MSNSKKEIVSQLRSEQLTIRSDASLYETMALKSGIYSLTPMQLEAKRAHHQGFIDEISHIDHKMSSASCLNCERVFECSFNNRCKKD